MGLFRRIVTLGQAQGDGTRDRSRAAGAHADVHRRQRGERDDAVRKLSAKRDCDSEVL